MPQGDSMKSKLWAIVFAMSWQLGAAHVALAETHPSFEKVFTIVFENGNYGAAMKQPFFAKVAASGALLRNMHAVVHPSQANYIAMISGSMNGVVGDGSQNVTAASLVDLLQARGLSWKVYAEGYPTNRCFTGSSTGRYVRKHNPFISFTNVQHDPSLCAHIVNASELDNDVATGTLPTYSFYVPDLSNDGHDTGVAYADHYFSKKFGPLFSSPVFMSKMLVIATFDENDGSSGNQIYTALLGDSVTPGTINDENLNHYNVLRTIEDTLGLGSLRLNDLTATPISGVWR